jgi:signal recognition particle receptor subunit beta
VVDVAGHPRVRHQFEGFMPRARGIVFVLDSVEFSSQKSEVAEALYEVLTHPTAHRRRLPLLLACNKAGAMPG